MVSSCFTGKDVDQGCGCFQTNALSQAISSKNFTLTVVINYESHHVRGELQEGTTHHSCVVTSMQLERVSQYPAQAAEAIVDIACQA